MNRKKRHVFRRGCRENRIGAQRGGTTIAVTLPPACHPNRYRDGSSPAGYTWITTFPVA
jgi:hypothetical protein